MRTGVVSVILPCFNAESFLGASLGSLLTQDYAQLEILAIDDGSTDATGALLDAQAASDRRVRVLRSRVNRGLIAGLNWGLSEASGEYVARMDADDVAFPERIGMQVRFLERHADIDVVGGGIELIDESGDRMRRQRPVRCFTPAGARFMSLFATPIAHVSLLARAPTMKGYSYGGGPDALHTEDYELFSRMIAEGIRFANLPDPVVQVRVRSDGVSLGWEAIQSENFVTCARRHMERMLGCAPDARSQKVLVNRMDDGVRRRDLRAGLELLGRLEAEAAAADPAAAAEIRAIGDEQRVEILLQALAKGRHELRLAASALAARSWRRLTSRAARRYVAMKLGRKASRS